MNKNSAYLELEGISGICGTRSVFLGFATARQLHSISFADVFNEDTGVGYQRPRNRAHSVDFKRYILQSDSSTIPLTFNLREELKENWSLIYQNGGALLRIRKGIPCLAQVDCQHRIGELGDEDVPLAFMAFIGLDFRSEMAMFTVINSKARGLSSSLTDYHRSNLVVDLKNDVPELYLARRLNEENPSPWCGLIKYGGESTSGLKRRTSLRMMQNSIHQVLIRTRCIDSLGIEGTFDLLLNYWIAIAKIFESAWTNNRSSLITKGVGLYALSQLLADILCNDASGVYDEEYFINMLRPLQSQIDWGSHGMFSNAGGQKGAAEVCLVLKKVLALREFF